MKLFVAGMMMAFLALVSDVDANLTLRKKHHKKHHHKKHHKGAVAAVATKDAPASTPPNAEAAILDKMKALEGKLDKAEAATATHVLTTAKIDVNGPLPADFRPLFAQAVSKAVGSAPADIKILEENVIKSTGNVIVEVVFQGPAHVVQAVKEQAAVPTSPLATGVMMPFLVAKDSVDDVSIPPNVHAPGVDVDTEMPYGELEPFGREDTASELTESSIHESDAMVDQMEKAEVAEEKRSVFRALTRLRGAAITSFDGVARSQTGNIDGYNKTHKWRKTHPLHHLAAEESDITKWAFPDASDF